MAVEAARADAFIYWTGQANYPVEKPGAWIYRANNDGTGARVFIAQTAWDLAVTDSSIYWTAGADVGRAEIDGRHPDPRFIPNDKFERTGEIAIYRGRLYWRAGTLIKSADMSGAQGPTFDVGNTAEGNAFAVGAEGIFWGTDGGFGHVNLDGTNLDPGAVSVYPHLGAGYLSAEIDGGSLYWGGRNSQRITRISPALGGTGVALPLKPSAFLLEWTIHADKIHYVVAPDSIGIQRIGTANLDGTHAEEIAAPVGSDIGMDAVDERAAAVVRPVGVCASTSTCILRIHVPTGGRLKLDARHAKRRVRSFARASDFKTTLKIRGALRRRVAGRGHAMVDLRTTFAPAGVPGTLTSQQVKLRLKQ